jgi:hypothetical protein
MEWRKGLSVEAECSNRGICDRATGSCQCFVGFGSSNNNREAGMVENCGWREAEAGRLRGAHADERYSREDAGRWDRREAEAARDAARSAEREAGRWQDSGRYVDRDYPDTFPPRPDTGRTWTESSLRLGEARRKQSAAEAAEADGGPW